MGPQKLQAFYLSFFSFPQFGRMRKLGPDGCSLFPLCLHLDRAKKCFQLYCAFFSGFCALFMGPVSTLFSKKKTLKLGPTILFTHLKIILLQCFQFSVFNNKQYLNRLFIFISFLQCQPNKENCHSSPISSLFLPILLHFQTKRKRGEKKVML